jgi:SAM-dependent methyltransferase
MTTLFATTDDDLRRTWENQQAVHKRDRELRFQVMLDHVQQLTGPPRRVLDLACGPGSVTRRVLDRFPLATVVALDIDPLLLHLAADAFAADDRVEVVTRNLNDPGWANGIDGDFDAVLTTTAMHWLSAEALARVYRGVADLLRSGGMFANADWMPIAEPLLRTAVDDLHEAHLSASFAAGAESCDDWYRRAYALPAYRSLWPERQRRLAHWSGDLKQPAAWHRSLLLENGFAVAEVVWRRGNEALMVAVTT